MTTRTAVVAIVAAVITAPALAQDAIQWTEAEGGNGHWYQVISFWPDRVDWSFARDNAISRGGHLACITSEQENDIISMMLAVDQNTMLGGYRGNDSNWRWITGEQWSYTNWNQHDCHPSSQPDGESHLFYLCEVEDGSNKWNDFMGSTRWGGGGGISYVIEYSADCNGDGIVDYGQILDGTFADSDHDGVPDCCDDALCLPPVQWRIEDGGNGHWYRRVLKFLPWDEAADYAASLGGYLATLASSAEDTFIDGLIASHNESDFPKSDWWIGGFQPEGSPEPGGNWQWVTGETWSFADWGPGEPDDSGSSGPGDEQCLEYNGTGPLISHLSDEKNFQSQPLIIEWSADCNGDGIVDYGQILDGNYSDDDGNGVPDCCDAADPCDDCLGDLTGSGVVDSADLGILLALWGTDGKSLPAADVNGDGIVDAADLGLLLMFWGSCP